MEEPAGQRVRRVVLIGAPNVGKSTLFNRLTGEFSKTSNFHGTTVAASVGELRTPKARRDSESPARSNEPGPRSGERDAQTEATGRTQVADLPGVYSLTLDVPEARICREVTLGARGVAGSAQNSAAAQGKHAVAQTKQAPVQGKAAPADLICVVADAGNLRRGLVLAGQAMSLGPPVVLVVNMIDRARSRGLSFDAAALGAAMGARVLIVSGATGEGVDDLCELLSRDGHTSGRAPDDEEALLRWADEVYLRGATAPGSLEAVERNRARDAATDAIDRAVMHPVAGVVIFALVMGALFWLIFSLATIPMDMIDGAFGALGGWTAESLPQGPITDMLSGGVIGGVGATVIFLPQILLLFFVITLLEDSGYLARASLAADRLLRPFGLTGHAFVPLLSSHACALPGIMAARGVPDPRARLATILVAPFMSCTARIPVYVLLVSLLFAGKPMLGALAMVGAYALGVVAAVLSALLARRTILRGAGRAMAMELPAYKRPSLTLAAKTSAVRGWFFLRSAGTNILAISVVLWWLSAYPRAHTPEAEALAARAVEITAALPEEPGARAAAEEEAAALTAEATRLHDRHQARHSYIGRIGGFAQPVFAPLGFDRQLTVGVIASFAAREVFASTMSIVTTGEGDWEGALDKLARAQRDEGGPIFTRAASWSLLVYYVLAMQCLPTLAVTARESGHAKWAWLQFAWMTLVAYAAAALVYAVAA